MALVLFAQDSQLEEYGMATLVWRSDLLSYLQEGVLLAYRRTTFSL